MDIVIPAPIRHIKRLWAVATVVVAITALSPRPGSSTTLIVYRTDKEFVIAIDSRRVFTAGTSLQTTEPPFAACKAFEEHHAIFAFAGTDPMVWDPKDTVRQALKDRTSIRGAADVIAKSLSERYQVWLPHIAPELLAGIRQSTRPDGYATISHLALGAYEASGPVGIVIEFLLAPGQPPRVATETAWSCDATACPSEMMIFGEISKIVEYWQRRKTSSPDFRVDSLGRTAADRAAELVQVEIAGGSPKVGPPVAVAQISAQGVSWPYAGKCLSVVANGAYWSIGGLVLDLLGALMLVWPVIRPNGRAGRRFNTADYVQSWKSRAGAIALVLGFALQAVGAYLGTGRR